MSVFFRWGVFGILGVAALVYAYNASKHMADKRAALQAPAASEVAQPVPAAAEPVSEDSPSPRCAAELVVAQRALEARAQGEPLDRLLRIQEIAFQQSPRRERLEKVATDWYRLEGPAPAPGALSAAVVGECDRLGPRPEGS
jgi:hypothetical protein